MKNAIIIHGCSSRAEDKNDTTPAFDRHWISWARKALIARGIPTVTPLMPKSWEPKYEKWKEEFEKQDVNEETTLIGHSCGCAFLVRWLGDTKQKIDKLILVAPWKIAGTKSNKKEFYEYPIDETIASRVNNIIMFTADNEMGNGKKSLKIFHDALGGKIIELKGRGHYTYSEMQTEEFPELLEALM